MINKIIEALPAIKTAAIKGAALAAYVVDTMRDLRKYDPARDPNRTYRSGEILPEIAPLLEKARKRRGEIYITEKGIDLILEHQNKDPEECKRYIMWKYLGELTYKEAFLDPVKLQPEKAAEDLKAEITQLRAEITQLRAEIKALTQALNDQKNIILIAN